MHDARSLWRMLCEIDPNRGAMGLKRRTAEGASFGQISIGRGQLVSLLGRHSTIRLSTVSERLPVRRPTRAVLRRWRRLMSVSPPHPTYGLRRSLLQRRACRNSYSTFWNAVSTLPICRLYSTVGVEPVNLADRCVRVASSSASLATASGGCRSSPPLQPAAEHGSSAGAGMLPWRVGSFLPTSFTLTALTALTGN